MTDKPDDHTQTNDQPSAVDRREFRASTAALGALPVLANVVGGVAFGQETVPMVGASANSVKSIIGIYGSWAAGLASEPPELSFRNDRWQDVENWRPAARAKTVELVAAPDIGGLPKVKLVREYEFDGLHVEELQWQLPVGRPTQAVLLKPQNAK